MFNNIRKYRNIRKFNSCISKFILFYAFISNSAQADNSLRGYSVLMNWTEISHVHRERNPRKGGSEFDTTQIGNAKVYISDKGRLFGETEVRGEGGGRRRGVQQAATQQGPDDDDSQSAMEAVGNWHWSLAGNTLSGTKVFVQGARRVNAVVDRDGEQFRCQLQVILGKSDGQIMRTGGKRNAPEQVLSTEVSAASCQVLPGNAVAQ